MWLDDFKKYVLAEYPKEACGVLVGDKFIPITNIHPEPTKAFRLDETELLKLGNVYDAVCHSHPYTHEQTLKMKRTNPGFDFRWPSPRDHTNWLKSKKTWIIVSTDGEGISEPVIMDQDNYKNQPLMGREFIWGYQDCFMLARDYYKLAAGIVIPTHPPEWGFWLRNEQPFLDNFAREGFFEVEKSINKIQVGDSMLFNIMPGYTKSVMHCTVCVGNNRMITHQYGRLSEEQRIDQWASEIITVVRHPDFASKYDKNNPPL